MSGFLLFEVKHKKHHIFWKENVEYEVYWNVFKISYFKINFKQISAYEKSHSVENVCWQMSNLDFDPCLLPSTN